MGMFDTAKTVKTAPKAKKADKEVVVVEGLEQLAAIDAVIKSLTAVKDTVSATVKASMGDYFAVTGFATKKRPASFRGVENDASASCELRARASTSPLSDEARELLEAKNIPVQEVVGTVDTFVINPDYVSDPKIMALIEKHLKGVKGLPDDLFLHQEGKSKHVVAENALDVLFANHDADTCAELLPIISVLAVKPKMETDDLAKAFEIAESIINPTTKH